MTVLVFAQMTHERRREFASLTAMGAARGTIARIVVKEAMTADLGGGLVGIVVSAVLLYSFHGLVRQVLGAFVLPPAGMIVALAVLSLACVGLAAVVSAWVSVRIINRTDPSLVLTEGE